MRWSGRRDLNSRPLAPQASALARLRYAPTFRRPYDAIQPNTSTSPPNNSTLISGAERPAHILLRKSPHNRRRQETVDCNLPSHFPPVFPGHRKRLRSRQRNPRPCSLNVSTAVGRTRRPPSPSQGNPTTPASRPNPANPPTDRTAIESGWPRGCGPAAPHGSTPPADVSWSTALTTVTAPSAPHGH